MSRILAIALILISFDGARCQFSNALPGGRRASDDFDCAEEFGYYPHPSDCSRYYVCVFGGALEETCSAGLVYSTELQTCDWPRNVASCNPRSGEAHQSARAARLLDVGFNDRGRSGRLLDLGFNSRDNSAPNLFTNPPRGRHLTTRRPQHRRVPERNSLEHPVSGTSSSVAERFRLLGDVSERGAQSDQARDFDLDTRIGGRNNKIVARRQQTLIHVDDSRDNSNHLRPHPNTFRHMDSTNRSLSETRLSAQSLSKRFGVADNSEKIHSPLRSLTPSSSQRQPRRIPFVPPPLRKGGNPFLSAQVVSFPVASLLKLFKPSSVVLLGENLDETKYKSAGPKSTPESANEREIGGNFPEPNQAIGSGAGNSGYKDHTRSRIHHNYRETSLNHKNRANLDGDTAYHSTPYFPYNKNLYNKLQPPKPEPKQIEDSIKNPHQSEYFDETRLPTGVHDLAATTYRPHSASNSKHTSEYRRELMNDKSHRVFRENYDTYRDHQTVNEDYPKPRNQRKTQEISWRNSNKASYQSEYVGKSTHQNSDEAVYLAEKPFDKVVTERNRDYNSNLAHKQYSNINVFDADFEQYDNIVYSFYDAESKENSRPQHDDPKRRLFDRTMQNNINIRPSSVKTFSSTTKSGRESQLYSDQQKNDFHVPNERLIAPRDSAGVSFTRQSQLYRITSGAEPSKYSPDIRFLKQNSPLLQQKINDENEQLIKLRQESSFLKGRRNSATVNVQHRPKTQSIYDNDNEKLDAQPTLTYIYNYLLGNIKDDHYEELRAYHSPHIVTESGSLPLNQNIPSYFITGKESLPIHSTKSIQSQLPLTNNPFDSKSLNDFGRSGQYQTAKPASRLDSRNQLHLKPTDAPIQISTISSFSFGDTGTRFPLRSPSHAPFSPRPSSRPTRPSRPPPPPPRPHPSRGPQIHPKPSRPPRRRPEHTRFPPRHQSSTFVSSTRAPVDVRPVTHRSTFSFPTVTTPSTTTTAVTTPTPVSPAVGFTEPAYVAYFNDTIYDVYYIYDDDDIQYDELDYDGTTRFSRGPSVVTTPFSTITTTTTPSTTSARPSTSQRPLRNQIQTVFGPTKDRSPQRTPSFFSLENVRDDASDRKKTGRKRPVSRGKSSSASRQKKQSLNFAAGQTNTLGETFGTSSRPIVRPHTSISQQPVISKPTSKPQPSRERNSRNRVSLLTKNKLANLNRGSHPSNGLKSIDTGSPRQSISSSRHTKRPGSASKSSTAKLNIWAHPPRRPDPLYSQPRPDEPAERCDARCRLPDCNCGGTANPGGLKTSETPQLVVLTFDDSINDLNHDLYQEMFESKRVNPNGCPIAATFYVSHEWTNYQQVQNLYADGHEIASHSISHSFGEQFSTSKWEAEIAGQREILAAYGGVRMEDIRGMRAPFLSIGGNRMFKMLYNNNFTYDSSMPVYENNPPSWPYTLDYKIHHDCMIPPCPNKAYPGVWEVPMVMWQDLNGGRCSMVDACSAPPTAEEVYNMLIKNFQRHYTSNRAVFPLYFHAAWMTKKHHREGFMAFLDTISKMDDVWLVTNWQAIQWMRDPQSLSTIKQFQPFGCSYPERPARCVKARKCNVRHKSGVRYMTTCQACPKKYPWTGRTGV